MIVAIFVILLIAAGGAMIMRNAATGSKTLGDNYLRAQAQLLAQSATEYAVMRVQGFDDESNNCLNHINISVEDADGTSVMFDVNISMLYAFEGDAPSGSCDYLQENTGQPTRVLVDTKVSTHSGNNLSTEPITIRQRSWQTF